MVHSRFSVKPVHHHYGAQSKLQNLLGLTKSRPQIHHVDEIDKSERRAGHKVFCCPAAVLDRKFRSFRVFAIRRSYRDRARGRWHFTVIPRSKIRIFGRTPCRSGQTSKFGRLPRSKLRHPTLCRPLPRSKFRSTDLRLTRAQPCGNLIPWHH